MLGHEYRGGEKIVKDGVGVGDIDDAIVLGDLGDEVSGVEVVGDWHTESEDQAVAVVLHDLANRQLASCKHGSSTNLLNVCLGL